MKKDKKYMPQKNNFFYGFAVIILASLIVISIIYAWVEPSLSPPAGNVAAPLNTGSETQTKAGGLIIQGDVSIGTKLDVSGPIKGTSFCLGSECRSSWPAIAGGYWAESDSNIYNTNSGNVGIGLQNPTTKLQLRTESTSTIPLKIETPVGGGVSYSGSRTDTSASDWAKQSLTNLQIQDGDVLLAESTPSYSISSISSEFNFLYPPGSGGSPSYTAGSWTTYRTISLPASVKAIIAHVGVPAVYPGAASRVFYNGAQQGSYAVGYPSQCDYSQYPFLYFPPAVFDSGGGGTAELQIRVGSADQGLIMPHSLGYYISGSGYTLNTFSGYENGYVFISSDDTWTTVASFTIPSNAREVIVFHSALPQVSISGGVYHARTRVLYNGVEQEGRGRGQMSQCTAWSLGYAMIGRTSFNAGTGGTLEIQVQRDSSVCGRMWGYAMPYYITASSKYVSSGTLTSSITSIPGAITAVTPSWTATLNGQSITVDISVDGGTTWTTNVTNGSTYSFAYSPTESKLRYRVNFSTTDGFKTPILHDITLNYTYVTLPIQKTVFYIQNQTGRVGIGTENPQYLLDVEGAAQATAWYTGDIIFQKNKEAIWRLYEEEDGLYLENLKTGKKYKILLEMVEEKK